MGSILDDTAKGVDGVSTSVAELLSKESGDEIIGSIAQSASSRMHSLMRESVSEAATRNRVAYQMSFPIFGTSKIALLPRVLAMWAIVLPFIFVRGAFFFLLFLIAMGPINGTGFVAATGGVVATQLYYRDAMSWAQDNDTLQAIWDATAEILATVLNIQLYVLRLFIEIWNGLCPMMALLIDLVYELLRQLAVMWYAAPVLQYMAMWLLRFVVYTLETFLDALVSVAEAFSDFAYDMTVNLTAAMAAEGESQFGGRRTIPDEAELVGDVLLFVCVSIATLIIRLVEALVVAFLPLIYSFVRLILPKILGYMPPLMQIIGKVFQILTSEPVKRVLNFIIQAVPMAIEVIGAAICGYGIYLGSAGCYLLYIICTTLMFFMRYIIRPLTCGLFAWLAGCYRSFVRATFDGKECYSCGGYHTACGCDPRNSYPEHGCDGSTCTGGKYFRPAPAPPNTRMQPGMGTRVTSDDQFTAFAADPSHLQDITLDYNSQSSDDADIGIGGISTTTTQQACTYETVVTAADGTTSTQRLTCPDDGATVEQTYGVHDPGAIRRRRSDLSTAGTLPPTVQPTAQPTAQPTVQPTFAPTVPGDTAHPTGAPTSPPTTTPTLAPIPTSAPTNFVPYTDAPTAAPSMVPGTVVYTSPNAVISHGAVLTATPAMYAPVLRKSYTVTLPNGLLGVRSWFEMGSLPYKDGDGQMQCVAGALAGDAACSTFTNVRAALDSSYANTPAAAKISNANPWVSAEWGQPVWLDLTLPLPAPVSQVNIRWATMSQLTRAPETYSIEFHAQGTTDPEVVDLGPKSCLFAAAGRLDMVSTAPYFDHGFNVSRIRVRPDVPCHSDAHMVPGHGSPYAVALLEVIGPSEFNSPTVANRVAPWHYVLHSAAPQATDLPVFPTVSVNEANTEGFSMWDPCARDFAVQMVRDNNLNTVFLLNDGVSAADATLVLDIVLSSTDHDGFVAREPGRPVDSVVVHWAASSIVDIGAVKMCAPGTNLTLAADISLCASADTDLSSPMLRGYTDVVKRDLENRFGVRYENETNTAGAIFWSGDYTDTYLEGAMPSRGNSATFAGLQAAGIGADGHMLLVFLPGALAPARETTWDTVRVETNVLPEVQTSLSWTYSVEDSLDASGTLASIPNSECLPGRQTGGDFNISSANLAPYSQPFGNSIRKWFGITKLDMFVRASQLPVGGSTTRRSEVAGLGEESTTMWKTLARRYADRAGKPTQGSSSNPHKLAEQVRAHGSKLITSLDTARSHAHPHVDIGTVAPEHDLAHPFASAVVDMIADSEPVFVCTDHLQNGSTKAICQPKRPLLLPAPPVEGTPAPSESNSTSKHAVYGQMHTDKSVQTREEFLRAMEQVKMPNVRPWPRPLSKPPPQETQTRHSHERSLFGAANPAEWYDEMKEVAEEVVEAFVDNFEKVLCQSIGCSGYCPGRDCDSSSDLGECFKGFGAFIVRNLFACSNDDTIADCVINRLLYGFVELLDQLLDWMLMLVDICGQGVAKMLFMGDVMKIIACESCAVTGILVGVLVDFAESFSISFCHDIIDVGLEQCDKFGMGNPYAIGAKVFENMFGILKLAFGLFQVIPALIELTIEVCVFVGQTILDLFPELLGDAFDVILWFLASSDVVYTIETLFEAFDDIATEIDSKTNIYASRRNDAGNGAGFSQFTTSSASTQSTNQVPGATFVDSTEAAGACHDQSSSDSQAECDEGLHTTVDFFESEQARESVVQDVNTPVPPPRDSMSFNLGGCGCRVSHADCESGPGAGNCPKQLGATAQRNRDTIATARASTTAQDPNNRESWPHCPDVAPRLVAPTGTTTGPEFEKKYVASKRCYVQIRKSISGGGVNDMPLLSAEHRANPQGQSAPAWWPFKRFSKQSGTNTKATDSDIDLDEFAYSDVPHASEIHRRRRTSTSDDSVPPPPQSRRLAMAAAAMGVSEFYEEDIGELYSREVGGQHHVPRSKGSKQNKTNHDFTPEQQANEYRQFARDAAANVAAMLSNSNETYGSLQAHLLRRDTRKLTEFASTVWESLRAAEYKHIIRAAEATIGSGRRLLFGFSGATTDDMICGVSLGATDGSGTPIYPNTYPCCKGLWCCIPPPVPRDFRFKKEWFVWRDSWVENTKCPELRTYPDTWVFPIHAFAQAGKAASSLVVNVWPYTALVDALWSVFTFPGDRWPQQQYHDDTAEWIWYQGLCVGLNAGAYMATALAIFVIFLGGEAWSNFLQAHVIAFSQAFMNDKRLQHFEIDRRKGAYLKDLERRKRSSEQRLAASNSTHTDTWRDGGVAELSVVGRAGTGRRYGSFGANATIDRIEEEHLL